MNQNDLYIEYARVIEMCKGTALEDTPWLGVRENTGENEVYVFDEHPRFNSDPENYQFAVAILEDRPVFVGDKIYAKVPGTIEYTVAEKGAFADGYCDYPHCEIDDKKFSWQPPKPKRTFMLNGVELPCPARGGESTFLIGTCVSTLMGYRFGTHEDRDRVLHEIERILDEAGNKP